MLFYAGIIFREMPVSRVIDKYQFLVLGSFKFIQNRVIIIGFPETFFISDAIYGRTSDRDIRNGNGSMVKDRRSCSGSDIRYLIIIYNPQISVRHTSFGDNDPEGSQSLVRQSIGILGFGGQYCRSTVHRQDKLHVRRAFFLSYFGFLTSRNGKTGHQTCYQIYFPV